MCVEKGLGEKESEVREVFYVESWKMEDFSSRCGVYGDERNMRRYVEFNMKKK